MEKKSAIKKWGSAGVLFFGDTACSKCCVSKKLSLKLRDQNGGYLLKQILNFWLNNFVKSIFEKLSLHLVVVSQSHFCVKPKLCYVSCVVVEMV